MLMNSGSMTLLNPNNRSVVVFILVPLICLQTQKKPQNLNQHRTKKQQSVNQSRTPKPADSQHNRLPPPARPGQLGAVAVGAPWEAPAGGRGRSHGGRRRCAKLGERPGGRGALINRPGEEGVGKAAGTSWESSCLSLLPRAGLPAASGAFESFCALIVRRPGKRQRFVCSSCVLASWFPALKNLVIWAGLSNKVVWNFGLWRTPIRVQFQIFEVEFRVMMHFCSEKHFV